MNKRIFVLVSCISCFSWFARADVFAWRQPIRGGLEAGALYRLKVPPEMFDGCRAFPADIRIFDRATNQWPYFVWTPAPAEEVLPLDTEILNRSVDAGPDRFLSVDVHVPGRGLGEPRPRHDRITLNTGGSQFVRRVEVFGSEDGLGWRRMAWGYLVDQRREIQVTSRTIFYPVSDLPRLQVRIYPNATDANETVELLGVSVSTTVRKDGESEDVTLALSAADPKDRREGVSATLLDQGVNGRPLARLRIRAARGEFTRAVRVSGRSDTTNAWRWVAEGSIFRFGDQSRDTVDLKDAAYRYLLLEEFHYDDAPLLIDEVVAEAVPRYLVFEAGTGGEAEVHYGSTLAQVPRYDLQRRTKDDRIPEAPLAGLGKPAPLAPERPAPPYGRWLVLAGIGLASLIVILVVVNMVRRGTGSEG